MGSRYTVRVILSEKQYKCQLLSSLLRLNCMLYTRKSNPYTDLNRHWGVQVDGAPIFQEDQHMKAARLSAQRNGRLYPQEIFLVLISVKVFTPYTTYNTLVLTSQKTSVSPLWNRSVNVVEAKSLLALRRKRCKTKCVGKMQNCLKVIAGDKHNFHWNLKS
jgi:hypothetical protein